ncbi:MAG: hypothetical protein E6Q78_11515 [Rhodoferax sp.]|nr:MAG: hypothetical protein E6Q78_11515 [Rhodoferax sp.]
MLKLLKLHEALISFALPKNYCQHLQFENSAANAQNKLQATQTGQRTHRQQEQEEVLQRAGNKNTQTPKLIAISFGVYIRNELSDLCIIWLPMPA